MAIAELERFTTESQTENLVTETDSEQRQVVLRNQAPGQFNAMGHGRRITRPIGQKDTLRLMGQHSVQINRGRKDGDRATVGHQPVKDGSFDPEINCHNTEGMLTATLLQTLIKRHAARLLPAVCLGGRHTLREVEPFHRGSGAKLLKQLGRSAPGGADDSVHRARFTQMADQSPGIDPLNPDHTLLFQPRLKGLLRAPVAGDR